jgi:hypothetical protein
LCERGAVESADLARGTEHGSGGDGDDAIVLAHHARDDDMAVELRIGRVGS